VALEVEVKWKSGGYETQPKGIDQLWEHIQVAWHTIIAEVVDNLIGSMPDCVAEVLNRHKTPYEIFISKIPCKRATHFPLGFFFARNTLFLLRQYLIENTEPLPLCQH